MENLKIGSNGPAVAQLQSQLIKLGFTIAADGIFGPGTQAALIQFQQQHGLTADGIAGPVTLNVLNNPDLAVDKVNGIDISHHTGTINWEIIAGNTDFVYCKASQGSSFKDPLFETYFTKLEAAGIIRGGYHFLNFQGATAVEQANNFLSCGIDFSQNDVLPPVLDVEWQVPDSLNTFIKPNKAICIQLISDWLAIVEDKTGRLPMIYTNINFWSDYLGCPAGFEKYLLWTSGYQASPPADIPGLSAYTIWQNSGTGQNAAISGDVDTNIFNGTLDDLKNLISSNKVA